VAADEADAAEAASWLCPGRLRGRAQARRVRLPLLLLLLLLLL